MKTICLLAQFPPPMHGLSKAVETLYNSRLRNKYQFTKIDITNNKRILHTLQMLLRCSDDIVYFTPSQTSGGNFRDLIFLKIIQLKKKKCIIHIHGGFYRYLVDYKVSTWQRRMNYLAVKQLAGGIVLGHSLHSILEGMLPDNRIFVCPNCVDNVFIASSVDGKIAKMIKGEVLHILYLSNFIEAKGYKEVLKLAKLAQMRNAVDKFVFHFAGKFFDYREEMYFRENSKGLKNIVFHGVVGGKDKMNLLSMCHIFTLLSRYPMEGQPISIMEAMGNGMAIITTDHAGIPEIVSHNNGFVCSKNDIDIDDVYDYLLYCYQNRDKLASTGVLNYYKIKEKYTEKQYVDNMDKIFESI